jgi:hypothetical protein
MGTFSPARAPTTYRHFRCFGTPKAARVRCLWRLPVRSRLGSPIGGPFRRQSGNSQHTLSFSCGAKWLAQMHLGYHELRNMLMKFREEREKRKAQAAPPPVASSSGGGVAGRGSEHRSSRDDHRDRERDRDRDRGYSERHSSSRYEYVDWYLLPVVVAH